MTLDLYALDYIDKFVKGTFKFSCKVQDVKFNADKNNFDLTWEEAGETHSEIFDYVVVATGHFSVPNDPKFKGEETFTGKYPSPRASKRKNNYDFREVHSCS